MSVGNQLEEEDLEFLLGIVDNPHSDYDDELEGWPNYRIDQQEAGPVLIITFQDEDGDVYEGRWALELVHQELKLKGK